jgi:hypothetical protein
MSENKKPVVDAKTKMLEALVKKQKRNNTSKSVGTSTESKIGAGQTGGVAPRVHRRKSGSV